MSDLTTDDVRHWDVSVIRQLFQAAQGVGAADHKLGESLDNTGKRTNWNGQAGEAFRDEIGKQRTDLDRDGHESKGVAAALQRAEKDVEYCRNRLLDIDDRAREYGWTVTSDWRIDDSQDTQRKHDPQLLQNDLNQVKARAHTADHELATAIRAAVGDVLVDDQGHETGTPPPDQSTPTGKLTPEQQAQVGQWSQYSLDHGGGDCSRWAIASTLANKFGVREGPNGTEINLPADVQTKMMGGVPLHFPPTKAEIDKIATKQGVTPVPGVENDGLPGGPDLMTSQLNDFGLKSEYHTAASYDQIPGLVDQMTSDLRAGHSAIVNGAPQPGGGHFLSVTGITTGPNGETLYLVNDSNRASDGSLSSGTLPHPCTRQQLTTFLENRASAGPPGYSTVE